MKDPIGDLCQLIRRLPREARELFINHAAVCVGHPSGDSLLFPDPTTGEVFDLAMTVAELEAWLRRLVSESRFDDKFLVCGLLHDISDSQRRAAEPEGRAAVLDVWLSFIAQVDEQLQMPEAERPGGRSDSALRLARTQYEEDAAAVERMGDEAQAIHEAIEREWALTFDDAYWRERHRELLGIAFGGTKTDESDPLD